MRQVVEAEPVRPRAINPKADRDLETICLKCLEKDPDDRYGSAEDLAEELDCWLRGEPIAARPSHAAERIVKWAKRKPAVAALILTIIITISGAVAAVFGGILWHNKRLSDRLWRGLLDQARAERLALQPRRAVELLGEAAQIKRDPALRQEAIQAIAQPGMRLVHNLPFGRVFAVKFSPDGQMLAAGGWLMPTTGWKPRFAKGLVVWKWPSAEPLNEFAWDTQGPFAFSPVTPILAVPETNGTVTLRNPYTGWR